MIEGMRMEQMDRIKQMIEDFCMAEYSHGADFSDLNKVAIAYTTQSAEDFRGNYGKDIPVQAYLDIVNLMHIRDAGGVVFVEQFEGYESFCDWLEWVDFETLVSMDDHEWDVYYTSRPDEKPDWWDEYYYQ